MGNKPELYGIVSEGTNRKFRRVGKVAIWRQYPPPNTKRPPLKGRIEINGTSYQIGCGKILMSNKKVR
jgi:5-methylcytosine-specific restriction endonuclease McrBC regulatory subunit McrC